MKRYLKSSSHNALQLNFDIEVVMVPSYLDQSDHEVAAAVKIPDKVPKTSLPHIEKGIDLGPQSLADYNAFIQSVEELVEDYYDLQIVYRNQSKDESHYYVCLAKDMSQTLILDFKLKIRIATHDAHESKAADYNKKQEAQAIKQVAGNIKLKPLYIHLVLNDENEDVKTYDQAYLWIDERIGEKVEILKRKLRYRK